MNENGDALEAWEAALRSALARAAEGAGDATGSFDDVLLRAWELWLETGLGDLDE